MALVTCPECGRKVSERADACPNCGYPICASLQKSKQEEAQKDFDRGACPIRFNGLPVSDERCGQFG